MSSKKDDKSGKGKKKLRLGVAHERFAAEEGRVGLVSHSDPQEFSLDHELFDEERAALEELVKLLPKIVEEEVEKLENVDAKTILSASCSHPHDPMGFSGREGSCLSRHVFTDRFLVNCLLTRKLDIGRTEELLRKNLQYRFKRFGEWHAAGSVEVKPDESRLHGVTLGGLPLLSDVSSALKNKGVFWAVPGARSKNGEAIFYSSIKNYDPSTIDGDEAVDWVMWMMLTMCEMERVDTLRTGFIFICDMESMGWKHYDQNLEKKMAEVYQDTFPLRYGRFCMLKPPFIIRAVMQLMRLFLKKKLMDRMQICTSKKDVFKYVDPSMVPQEYGGDLAYTEEDFLRDVEAWEKKSSPYYRARMEHEHPAAAAAPSKEESTEDIAADALGVGAEETS